ncbi:putative HTH-type transcriptional regulator YbiH [Escherichia coli]|nr:putative HTH-type transcriptional regulator YbiH [Escherichia coli]
MNNPAMTIKGEQAKKQLIAAALAQFGEYGMNATTREIAAQAGQNIAAITYYFGSKEDLYLACAQWIADFIGEQFRPHAEEAERLFAQPQPDRAAIRELILRACRNMIKLLTGMTLSTSASLSPVSSSLPRQPTTVHEQVISPLHSHLTRLIAAWTGCDANDTRMILHTHALIGEILAFRLGKETILLRTGWTAFDEEKTELINQTVTCHIDLILQGLSQRSL